MEPLGTRVVVAKDVVHITGWSLFHPRTRRDTARYNVPTDPLDLCFPLSVGENDNNQNGPDGYKDWVPRP